jgi:hypothetical protein
MCVGLPHQAAADSFAVTFSTGDFTQTGIGNLTGGSFDKLFVFGLSDTVVLTPFVPVEVVVNHLRFEAGLPSSPPFTAGGTIERTFTVGSLVGPLFNDFLVQLGTPETGDILTISEGSPLGIGPVGPRRSLSVVTHGLSPTAVGIGFPNSGCCTFETALTATFTLRETPTPEPGTLVLMCSGLMFGARRFAAKRLPPR